MYLSCNFNFIQSIPQLQVHPIFKNVPCVSVYIRLNCDGHFTQKQIFHVRQTKHCIASHRIGWHRVEYNLREMCVSLSLWSWISVLCSVRLYLQFICILYYENDFIHWKCVKINRPFDLKSFNWKITFIVSVGFRLPLLVDVHPNDIK